MKLNEIQSKIDEIAIASDDPEKFHVLEDNLRNDFIKYIAKRKDLIGKKAQLVLSTDDIKCARWCG